VRFPHRRSCSNTRFSIATARGSGEGFVAPPGPAGLAIRSHRARLLGATVPSGVRMAPRRVAVPVRPSGAFRRLPKLFRPPQFRANGTPMAKCRGHAVRKRVTVARAPPGGQAQPCVRCRISRSWLATGRGNQQLETLVRAVTVRRAAPPGPHVVLIRCSAFADCWLGVGTGPARNSLSSMPPSHSWSGCACTIGEAPSTSSNKERIAIVGSDGSFPMSGNSSAPAATGREGHRARPGPAVFGALLNRLRLRAGPVER